MSRSKPIITLSAVIGLIGCLVATTATSSAAVTASGHQANGAATSSAAPGGPIRDSGRAVAAQPKPPATQQPGPGNVRVRKLDSSSLPCFTTITQPGGPGTTVNVFYNNCTGNNAFITPNNHATAFDGTYTYVNQCRTVPPGSTTQWTFPPSTFPPGNTDRWGITNCI